MSFLIHHPVGLPLAVVAGLLTLWVVAGLMATRFCAALADLALTLVERRRTLQTAHDTLEQDGA